MKITLVFILLLPFSLCAQWETTSLPQARNDLNGISIDDQIYFLGGKIEGGLRSDIIDIYNTSTKEWSTIEMPEPAFQYHRSIEVDNKLYIQEDYSRFLTYNLTTDEWSELNTPHSISSLTKMDNFLIVSNSYKFSMYDTNIDTWKTFEFTDRSDNSLVAGNGKIIIAGGSDGSLEMNLVEIFDQQSETWATDTLSIPRDEIQSVYHDNKFYFIGGEAMGLIE